MTRRIRQFYKFLPRLLPRMVAVFVGLALLAVADPAQARRMALIVGNSDYQGITKLKNPVNDADAMAAKLRELGFEVTLLTDIGSDDFWTRLDQFSAEAETAESTLFFYSGHAFQLNGVNYLVPVAAQLTSRDAIKAETWSLDSIIARLQNRKRQTLIFLDACRNDPLPSSVRGSGAAADGLARLQTGVGTFVAFATKPGAVTFDGHADAANSPFTTALLAHMDTPGISISDMMIRVRNEVEQNTLRRQTPWDQSSLSSQFYFQPEVETKQELSAADYELLAQLAPADRKKFLDLLRASGFSDRSLDEAEAAIEVASLDLETLETTEVEVEIGSAEVAEESPSDDANVVVADGGVTVGADDTFDGDLVTSLPATPAVDDANALPTFEIAEGTTEIGEAGDDDAPATQLVNLPPKDEEDDQAPIRLAALTGPTRNVLALNATVIDRLRVEGALVTPDTEENRAILARIDPELLTPDAPALDPRQLARVAQTELRRLGCYRMKVDGAWGRGSRTALTSYFLAKKVVPDTLEPTMDLVTRLQAEDKVVCELRVARAAPQKPVVRKAEPAAAPVSPKTPFVSRKSTGGGGAVDQNVRKTFRPFGGFN